MKKCTECTRYFSVTYANAGRTICDRCEEAAILKTPTDFALKKIEAVFRERRIAKILAGDPQATINKSDEVPAMKVDQ